MEIHLGFQWRLGFCSKFCVQTYFYPRKRPAIKKSPFNSERGKYHRQISRKTCANLPFRAKVPTWVPLPAPGGPSSTALMPCERRLEGSGCRDGAVLEAGGILRFVSAIYLKRENLGRFIETQRRGLHEGHEVASSWPTPRFDVLPFRSKRFILREIAARRISKGAGFIWHSKICLQQEPEFEGKTHTHKYTRTHIHRKMQVQQGSF